MIDDLGYPIAGTLPSSGSPALTTLLSHVPQSVRRFVLAASVALFPVIPESRGWSEHCKNRRDVCPVSLPLHLQNLIKQYSPLFLSEYCVSKCKASDKNVYIVFKKN